MTPLFKICNSSKCNLQIVDINQDSDAYVPENIDEKYMNAYYEQNKFKYSQTATINIIQKNTIDKEEIVQTIITNHNGYLDEAYYQIQQDGFYTIYHIILPTIDWLKVEIKKDNSFVRSIKNYSIYVCDCDRIYEYVNDTLKEISSEILSQVNSVNTTISILKQDSFFICNLFACYISLCNQLFKTLYKCDTCKETDNSKTLIRYKRDFIWSTINVLKYYIQSENFLEAQRVLENVEYCGGICNDRESNNGQKSGCGCSG